MSGGKYCKLDCNIIYSSMWREDSDTRVIWVSLLALKDENGIVRQNVHGIARMIGISVDKVVAAIERFQLPDNESTTPDFEGRRIEKVEDGYLILNHFKYRNAGSIDDKRLQDKIRQQRHRDGEISPQDGPAKDPKPQFKSPSLDEVKFQAAKIGLPEVEAEKFFHHFESNGWKVGGRSKMVSWTSALAKWKSSYQSNWGRSGIPAGRVKKCQH